MFAIVPVGKINDEILNYLQKELNLEFGREVRIFAQIKIPQNTYNALRKQYNSEAILDKVLSKPDEFEKILAVIDKDIYAPELNFVFGKVNKIGGDKGIISIIRLSEGFYGRPEDKELFFKRVLKEAAHEFGHLCGITHCGNSKCVMYFSNSILDTDAKEQNFCRACRLSLETKVKSRY